MTLIQKSILLLLLVAGCVGSTQAKNFNLVTTDPAHPIQTINGKRYVFANKGEQVSFKANPETSFASLSWKFQNGSPATASDRGPHTITYGSSAEGLENVVQFMIGRFEGFQPCVTPFKRTCAVIVGAIKRAGAPASGGTETFESITDANKNVLPGQKIILKCEIPSLTVQEYEWILPGKTFKDYTANQTTGTLTQLADGDKKQQIVRFYWADTGDAREVKCRVKIDNQWHDIKNKIDVKKPTATFTTTLGTAAMNAAATRIGLFADADSSAGITYTGNVTVPAGFPEGKWNWIQLATPQMTWEAKTGIGPNAGVQKKKWSQNGIQGLDTDYPYEPSPYTQHPGNAGAYDTNSSHTDSDTPSVPLNPFVKAAVNNQTFVMYLMFLPPGEQSRYVPTRKVDWSFSISATKTGFNWAADVNSPAQSASASAEVSDHPIWTSNAYGAIVNQ